jgi:hypothetical protein
MPESLRHVGRRYVGVISQVARERTPIPDVAELQGTPQNGVGQGRAFQEALRFLFRAEQCADPAFERLVTRAGAPEKCVALFERTLQDGLEEVIEPFSSDPSPSSVSPVSSR